MGFHVLGQAGFSRSHMLTKCLLLRGQSVAFFPMMLFRSSCIPLHVILNLCICSKLLWRWNAATAASDIDGNSCCVNTDVRQKGKMRLLHRYSSALDDSAKRL